MISSAPIKRACWLRHALALLAAIFASLLLPQEEARANIVCQVNNASLSMGTSTTGVGTITYSCTNWWLLGRTADLCVMLGNPSWPGTAQQPILRGPNDAQLRYNVFRDPSRTTIWTQAQPLIRQVSFGFFGSTISGSFQFYAAIAPGQSVPPGTYQASFFNMVLGFANSAGTCSERNVLIGSGQQFTAQISHVVANSCTIAALGDADLGAAPSTGGTVIGSTTIAVRCPVGTAYNIGLRPSNGNSTGGGVMQGSGGGSAPAATLPYQLRRGSASGQVWGNTASPSGPGNGVGGTGSGAEQTFPVFVSVPSTNVAPGTYRDTVIVTVHF